MGSRFTAGENFRAPDASGNALEAVISESARRILFERQSPLGKRLRLQFLGSEPYNIVGVIPDVPDPDKIANRPVIYVQYGTPHTSYTSMWVVARVDNGVSPGL